MWSVIILVVVVVCILVLLVPCCLLTQQIMGSSARRHREPSDPREDALEIKVFNMVSENDVNARFTDIIPESVPRLPTSQPVPNTGVDSSSGFLGSQQHLSLSPGIASPVIPKIFPYEELEEATGNFSQINLLGTGGFADVYKGTLPGYGYIAVKRLNDHERDGERAFKKEVEIISSVRHRHLLSFLGYCIHQNQRLLVCDFVPNNTLQYHLHGEGQPTLEWPNRLKIAIGTARGIEYLHEGCHPKIIHRDIKPSNILLDSNFEAKIADFGLAKLVSEGSSVNTMLKGTRGYLDPEYASTWKLTDKSDVFSFGVVLLELITGRKSLDLTLTDSECNLAHWARPLLDRAQEHDILDTLVDARLENYDFDDMMRVVACAASCVQVYGRSRPCMKQIVRVLEDDASPRYLQQVVPGFEQGHSTVS